MSKNKLLALSILSKIRNYFLTGILVTAPIAITIYIIWTVVSFIDNNVKQFIPTQYRYDFYLPFNFPGLGIIIAFLGLTIIGMLAAGVFGKFFISLGEKIVHKTPIIRSIYGATKQIFEAIITNRKTTFSKVVLFEYPRKGVWSIGFISSTTKGEVQYKTKNEVVNIFLPTTPNPTSGFLLFIPLKDLIILDMTVDEGIKMVISAGIVTPKKPNK